MTDDERLERGLRDALAARDLGPPSPELRRRMAVVSIQQAHMGWRGWLRSTRPAGTIGLTAAALVLGLLLVAVVRAPTSTGPAGPGATPSLAQPGVTAPLARSVIAVDPKVVAGAILAVILFAWLRSEAAASKAPSAVRGAGLFPHGFGWLRKRWLRRLTFGGLLVVFVGVFPVRGGSMTLTTGSFFSAGGAHYLGRIPGHAGPRDVVLYRYPPDGKVSFVQAIRNTGPIPITILDGDPARPWMEFRLFAEHAPDTGAVVGETPTFPLVPVEIAPNGR